MKRLVSMMLVLTMILSLFNVVPVQAASYDETAYTLTGVQVNDIIEIAKTQVGYMEGNNSNQLDGTYAGSGNYTKYAKELGNAGHNASNPNAWCAYFVSWCAMKSGCLNSALPFFTGVKSSVAKSKPYKSNGIGTYHAIKKHTFTKGSVFSKDYTPSNIENYKPRKGDIMVFKGHVGLVISDYNSSTNSFVIIEGNAGKGSTKVNQRTVYMNNSELVGFITPDYSTTTITSTHTHSYSYSNDSAHPHSEYKYCSCGHKEYTGSKKLISSCKSCHPVGSLTLKRSVEKSKGNATFYRNNVTNANSYTLQVCYANGTVYGEYDMNQDTYTVNGIPSGEYYAVLYAKNNSTGEQRSASCDYFKIIEKYDVVFNTNGGTGAPSNQTKYEDAPLTLTSQIPSKEGHIFKGWASSKNAITSQYQAGGIYTKNAKITLYAVWEPETYTIKFDANDGIGTVADEKVTYGNTIKMPNSVIKDYAYLKGWSVNKNSAKVDYSLNTDYKIKQNLTLYAVWGDASWDNEISTSLSGKGTQEEPYLISTAADLAYLANKVNTQTTAPNYEYYKLTDNINLNYSEWKPIGIYGNENQYFYGSFDGNGYTISDMYITSANERYIGLFGYVKDSEIKNLTVTGAIEGISSDSDIWIGGLTGKALNSNLENLTALHLNIGGISADEYNSAIATIVANAESSKVLYCSSKESHIDVKKGNFYIGMIAGYTYNGNIKGCSITVSNNGLFSSSVTAKQLYIGGICGYLSGGLGGKVENCIVKAPCFSNNIKVESTIFCGGIIGYAHSKWNIRACTANFTDKTVNSMTLEADWTCYVGGILGYDAYFNTISDCIYDGGSIVANKCSKGVEVGGFIGCTYAWSDERTVIERCVANVDGVIYGTTNVTPEYGYCYVGGGIGNATYTKAPQDTSIRLAYAKNLIVFADEISANTPKESGIVGNIVGKNRDDVFEFSNVYYNAEMNVVSSTGNINTSGTAKSIISINIPFYKNVMGFETYSSIENLKSNENAVWVLKNGELPELYYNCLNDITVSGDIVNGTVTVDKTQAVDGETVTISATPDENYVVNKIYVNGEEKDSTFTMNGDCEIYVTFAEKVEEYNVSISANDNATGTLENVDSAEPALMSVQLMSAENDANIKAKDGEEIKVNTTANKDYAIETIYVNGEEIAGDSFILTKDSEVTLEVLSISTDIIATTYDAEYVGSYSAVVGGSVLGENEDAVKYIRYWSADDTDTVYTSEVESGSGEYTVELIDLMAETTYYYQMTEFGEVKSFTTLAESDYDDEHLGDEDGGYEESESQSITTTTYKTLTSTYKFSIECSKSLTTEFLMIVCYDKDGKLLAIKEVECDGDTSYTGSVPIDTNIDYAKIFVWENKTKLIPVSTEEIVYFTN